MKKFMNAIICCAALAGIFGCSEAIVVGAAGRALGKPLQDVAAENLAKAASFKGRNLFVGIQSANVDREACGLETVWPRLGRCLASDEEDISGMRFATAEQYFYTLFDIRNEGKTDHAPYVNVPKDLLNIFNDGKCGWIVAANVLSEYEDTIPVLISANVDPRYLRNSYQGGESSIIPIGTKAGRRATAWGDRYVVAICKNGVVRVISAENFSLDAIYDKQSFDAPQLVYLDVCKD